LGLLSPKNDRGVGSKIPYFHLTSNKVLANELFIKEVEDGIWLVSFLHYDLGYIDLEQRTLQPLDNPFGPRLSPMS